MTDHRPDGPDSPSGERYGIRSFRSFQECRECVALQEKVWGRGFSERVPAAILRISQRLSGIAAGAFDEDGELVGFVFGLTGLEEGEPIHWSDMLAVRPGLRNSGLGIRLKLYQRSRLLEKGVRRVLWSFDPLESRNAHVNLNRLGAVGREYVENMYGESDSPLHRGLGTDRLVVVWALDAPRVVQRLEEGGEGEEEMPKAASALAASPPVADPERPAPDTAVLKLEDPVISVAIPAGIQALKELDSELARRWREATRVVLPHYLERGWEVRGLRRSGPVSHLMLVREGVIP